MINCIIAEDFKELNDIYSNLISHEKEINLIGSAADGESLLTLLEKKQADVVLMDIEMGSRNDGINCCRYITSKYPQTKVVMLTCHEEEDKIVSSFEAGAVDYILKTSSLSDIIDGIKGAYEGTSFIHPHAAGIIRKRLQQQGELKEKLFKLTKNISSLTQTEMGILKLIINGSKQREIAQKRHIEIVTVKSHITSIIRKFECKRSSDIVKVINENDLTDYIMSFND